MSVLSIDWDGHGPSLASTLDFQQVTRSLPIILQKIYSNPGEVTFQKNNRFPPCYLMGHGAGGALALLAAARPEINALIRGSVVVSPLVYAQHSLESASELILSLRPGALAKDVMGRAKFYGMRGVFPGLTKFQSKSCTMRMKVGINPKEQYRVFAEETFSNRRALKKLSTPTLWIHGRLDRVAPYEEVRKILDQVSGNVLERHVFEGKGHLQTALTLQTPALAAQYFEKFI